MANDEKVFFKQNAIDFITHDRYAYIMHINTIQVT